MRSVLQGAVLKFNVSVWSFLLVQCSSSFASILAYSVPAVCLQNIAIRSIEKKWFVRYFFLVFFDIFV